MSRKSSWWLRLQRNDASNRAALNEAKYFMEHNKVLRERINELTAENDKLREQTELLITLLRNDCDIEASWDGLRHFWSIELTDDGCLMRDRACKTEAENAKLQASNEVIAEDHAVLCEHNAKLRELVRDYEHCSMHADCGKCEYDGMTSTHCPLSPCFPDIDELRELGVEVE